ncbi:endonuclease MutS2 [Bacillus sp. RG28]|uniref:Endonuclease MutS2 n=1 Tax=Gottfriedia endophytica TaxID=2820819 RepID=A0A940NT52_9BACI|nr:endonuclease MutS2 [Gottfriedia endophytica]MBP0726577.1 endonuclease MutS2 [Gottfriedia endophytica]
MNSKTYSVLQYDQIKEEVAHFALTDSGKNYIRNIKTITNVKQIESLLEEINEAKQILVKSSSVPIHGLNGIEIVLSQLNKGIALRPDQLNSLYEFLDCCRKLKRYMKDKEFLAPRVSSYVYAIEELPKLAEEIYRCIRNGAVDDYASKNLEKIRKQMSIQEDRLKEKMNQILKSSKYKPYLQEAIISQRDGRFVIPVKKEYKGKIKGAILDTSASGSTCYIEPQDITPYQEQLILHQVEDEFEVERILSYLTGLVEENEEQIQLAVETMVHYDVLFAKAKYSHAINGRSVSVNESHYIDLKEARHPLLGQKAVPLTVELGKDYHALVITGPNTGGKTVTIKTVGLLTLMVQSGLHIPVGESSHISIFQKILLDIGDGQSIEQNLSTFSSRITNIIDILKETNDHSLVLLDELGSGTDPGEGMGLATAILQELYRKGATILATTHYSEIKGFAETHEGFINGSMEFDLETLKPTYKLIVGKGGESQAFSIALRLGMHPKIIENAHEITYKEKKEYFVENIDLFARKELEKQLAVNRHNNRKQKGIPKEGNNVTKYVQGDNVQITSTGEFGIVYKGPDQNGNYIVQVKGEKITINHKRIKLYISAKELYPEDYDFDIVFESIENRKKSQLMEKKFVEGLIIERNE